MRLRQLGGAVSIKPYRGPPMTLGNAAAARVRLEEAATWRRIVAAVEQLSNEIPPVRVH
jgi:hypothetical protein